MPLWVSPEEHKTEATTFSSIIIWWLEYYWAETQLVWIQNSPPSLRPRTDPVTVTQSPDPLESETIQPPATPPCVNPSFIHSFQSKSQSSPPKKLCSGSLAPHAPPPPLGAMTSPAAWRTQPPSPPINLPLQSHWIVVTEPPFTLWASQHGRKKKGVGVPPSPSLPLFFSQRWNLCNRCISHTNRVSRRREDGNTLAATWMAAAAQECRPHNRWDF